MFSPGEEVEEWEDERGAAAPLWLLRNGGWRIPKATHLFQSAVLQRQRFPNSFFLLSSEALPQPNPHKSFPHMPSGRSSHPKLSTLPWVNTFLGWVSPVRIKVPRSLVTCVSQHCSWRIYPSPFSVCSYFRLTSSFVNWCRRALGSNHKTSEQILLFIRPML